VIDLSHCREGVCARLEAEGRFDLSAPLHECGDPFELVCCGCAKGIAVVKQCRKRWCPSCARIISLERIDRYQQSIDAMQWPLLVTLTMPHTIETSCPSDVRKLRRALGKLRRLRWFKRAVKGGITSIEVTGGENGWHPHAHMLLDCRWLSVYGEEPRKPMSRDAIKRAFKVARNEVAEQWALCIQTSARVQVAISRARPDVAREVLKYAVKPSELAESPLPLAPLIDILRVSRLVSAFGSVRECRLEGLKRQLSEEEPTKVCECGCSTWMPDFVVDRMLDRGDSLPRALSNCLVAKSQRRR
jgi:hypothetical protein